MINDENELLKGRGEDVGRSPRNGLQMHILHNLKPERGFVLFFAIQNHMATSSLVTFCKCKRKRSAPVQLVLLGKLAHVTKYRHLNLRILRQLLHTPCTFCKNNVFNVIYLQPLPNIYLQNLLLQEEKK